MRGNGRCEADAGSRSLSQNRTRPALRSGHAHTTISLSALPHPSGSRTSCRMHYVGIATLTLWRAHFASNAGISTVPHCAPYPQRAAQTATSLMILVRASTAWAPLRSSSLYALVARVNRVESSERPFHFQIASTQGCMYPDPSYNRSSVTATLVSSSEACA